MNTKRLAFLVGLLVCLGTAGMPAGAVEVYGPTKPAETLWEIAARVRPDPQITVQQMMVALLEKNPHAFNANNVNTLQRGSYLAIPERDEIRQLGSADEALLVTQQNNRTWQASSQPLPAPARTLAEARRLQAELSSRIQALNTELKQEQRRGQELAAQLKLLQENAAANPAGTDASSPPLKSLETEIQQLKVLVEQKDQHIQILQASLREASIVMKRQYAESQNLYAQLQAATPGAAVKVPVEPPAVGTASQPSLTLEPVPDTPPSLQNDPPDAAAPDATAQPAASGPVSALEWLERQFQDNTGSQADPESGMPSRLSLVVALAALLFILALLWRSYDQQRNLNRKEEQLRDAIAHYDAKHLSAEPSALPHQA